MSKQSVYSPRRLVLSKFLGVLCLTIMLALCATSTALGQQVTTTTEIAAGLPGQTVELAINLTNHDPVFETGGFDLLVRYDASALALLCVTQGQMLDDCEWEYFNFRSGSLEDCGDEPCPEGTVRLVAVAETVNGSHHPVCFASTTGEVATLLFRTTVDDQYEGHFIPVEFIWYDCGDNAFSSRYGDSLYLSNEVFSPDSQSLPYVDSFPTVNGAPSECLMTGTITRNINFQHGGIDILDDPMGSLRGDLNLNGTPYEIGDAIVFTNYFIYGLSAFTLNIEAQIAASDVNADGITLTVADYITLLRIISGDTRFPETTFAPATDDTVVILQDTLSHTISFEYSQNLVAMQLVFDGDITPIADLPEGVMIDWHFDSSVTRVVILPDFDHLEEALLEPGLLFSFSGTGLITEVDATNELLEIVPISVMIADPFACCDGSRGNVDSDDQDNINIADLTFLVTYLFSSGPPPTCVPEANVDGDPSENVNVADLTQLVSYLFGGGAIPLQCP